MREQYTNAQIVVASLMPMNRFARHVVMKFEIERLQIRFVSLLLRFKKSKKQEQKKVT